MKDQSWSIHGTGGNNVQTEVHLPFWVDETPKCFLWSEEKSWSKIVLGFYLSNLYAQYFLKKKPFLYKKYFRLIVSLGWTFRPNLAEPLFPTVKAAFQWSANTISCNASPWKRFNFSADFQIYGSVQLPLVVMERVPVCVLPGREGTGSVRSEWKWK